MIPAPGLRACAASVSSNAIAGSAARVAGADRSVPLPSRAKGNASLSQVSDSSSDHPRSSVRMK
jgi:hypothetical protein